MSNIKRIPDALRKCAQTVADNPHARDAIAEGFQLIADALEGCQDCGSTQGAALAAPVKTVKPKKA